jgi:hypothetical protein
MYIYAIFFIQSLILFIYRPNHMAMGIIVIGIHNLHLNIFHTVILVHLLDKSRRKIYLHLRKMFQLL